VTGVAGAAPVDVVDVVDVVFVESAATGAVDVAAGESGLFSGRFADGKTIGVTMMTIAINASASRVRLSMN